MARVTVGLDIGTTSVKAAAVDDDGNIVARARVPHRLVVPAPDRFEHDADQAWRRGPRRALAALGDLDIEAVSVSAMVPSLTAVNRRGRPVTPGLLYGDARGRTGAPPGPAAEGEVVEFLRWTAREAPDASGFWPAPAVANRSLGGPAVIDYATAFTCVPLFGAEGWDQAICSDCGVRPDQLPGLEEAGVAIGRVDGDGPILGCGAIDVMCEQAVAGADRVGDVHVLCGTTLIVWALTDHWREAPGLWTVGRADPGTFLIGGASNAGGLFMDWAGRLAGKVKHRDTVDPERVPVWLPYPRGERTPYHDPGRRAALVGLDLTHGPAAVQRAAWEASGFVVRHHIERAGVAAQRVVATGGGTRVAGWMQALADTTGLPVHVSAFPEGAAVGAAFIARVAAGLENSPEDAGRWARSGRVIEPDPRWAAAASGRYARFRQLSDSPPDGPAR
ncbi:MAG TPA: FGGY-family carbohydrate kinase [Acidimicrobiales bacterium]|nr:FGGY-family carbohydrate kinase [Acidimicrobiales bacterium]